MYHIGCPIQEIFQQLITKLYLHLIMGYIKLTITDKLTIKLFKFTWEIKGI